MGGPFPMKESDYQAQSDARTLMDAHDVKRDAKRHGAAKRHAAKQSKAFGKIAGMHKGMSKR